MIRVRYFAAARELTGCEEESLELPGRVVATTAVRSLLAERHPRLRDYVDRMRFAINGELARNEGRVSDGDEVDVLPPVAGGAGGVALVAVREAPLSVDECMHAVRHPGAGGIAVFTGVVRDHAGGKPVSRLDYEAHPDLAASEMRRVLSVVVERDPEVRIAATHRVGSLSVGDVAVVVAASAPHRAEAFAACREGIDRIKETVPIWKKEWAPDGTTHWVNLDPC